jgi:hypothetical protein
MDADVDDILANAEKGKKKKRINSDRKGKRVELELAKVLNKRFEEILSKHADWGRFSRTVGSGNRWGQKVQLGKKAKEFYSGDMVCPENFKFTIESKGGYEEIDLCSALDGGNAELNSFLEKATDDAKRCDKKPMLIWKKNRKPRLVFVKAKELGVRKIGKKPEYSVHYRDWIGVPYSFIFSLDDSFFFEEG